MGKDAGFSRGLGDFWFFIACSGQIVCCDLAVVGGATIADATKAWP